MIHSGLYCRTPAAEPSPVPLMGVSVDAEIVGTSVKIELAQRFKNAETNPIEAVYLFPLPTAATIHDLTIRIGDRTIRGSLQERAKATAVYEAARRG